MCESPEIWGYVPLLTAVTIALLYLEFATVLKMVHSSKMAIFALSKVIQVFKFLVFFLPVLQYPLIGH